MLKKLTCAAVYCAIVVGSVAAERPLERAEYEKLHGLREVVCATGQEIMFAPVSVDKEIVPQTWLVVTPENSASSSRYAINDREKAWLQDHPCDQIFAPRRLLAKANRSGDLKH